MSDLILPALYAVLIWWFSTGVVLYLDSLPRKTYWRSLSCASVLAGGALYGLWTSSHETTVASAFTAFNCALMIWAWVELSFLLGFITGPRKTGCPAGCSGVRHFGHGVMAVLYHEFALIVAAAIVFALTRDAPNQFGLWTFVVLWAMRESAKLNVFFGVRNLSEEFLPDHLRYLESYFRRRPMNPFFPVSITVSTAVAGALLAEATAADATPYDVAGFTLLLSLLGLAILELWFLVLPISLSRLWSWAARRRQRLATERGQAPSGGCPTTAAASRGIEERNIEARLMSLPLTTLGTTVSLSNK